jgi:two-component system LytT family sensor kinase
MSDLKISNLITHLGGWLLFFSLPVIFMSNQQDGGTLFRILAAPAYWMFCLTFLVLFYLVAEILIPLLYLQGKYLLYFGVLGVLFTGIYFFKPFGRLMEIGHQQETPYRRPPPPPHFDIEPDRPGPPHLNHEPASQIGAGSLDLVSVFLFVMIVALTMAIKMTSQFNLTKQRALRAETKHTEAQLSFLKAQINPHFLFNTLNNIYTLAVISSSNTAESIMKLSNIMRYIADETNQRMVSLEDEIDCASDFIGLQKLRLSENSPVDFQVSGKLTNQQIAPLILMTFVENAFKYGISKHYHSPVIINIRVNENDLIFKCENKIFESAGQRTRAGIGISNTKQRLDFLYPDRHELIIDQVGDFFTVYLKISLN